MDLIHAALGVIARKRIAVWGVAFKPGTDGVRDSAGLQIGDQLRLLGAEVTVYDPMASGNTLVAFPELAYADSPLGAAAAADLLLVVTVWPEFAQIAPADVAGVIGRAAVIDACRGKGIDDVAWREIGWDVSSLTGASVR